MGISFSAAAQPAGTDGPGEKWVFMEPEEMPMT
jgi:hypothetical protein